MRKVLLIGFAALGLAVCSCTAIFLSLYGIHSAQRVDDVKIKEYARALHIPDTLSYRISENYYPFLKKIALDTSLAQASKNHLQPLQVLYFDASGSLRAFVINCYVRSAKRNLQWNEHGRFETFPAKQTAPLDSIFTFSSIRQYLVPLFHQQMASNAEYTLVIFWNHFMGRQTLHLLELVQKQINNGPKHLRVLYVNNDNLFVD